MSRPARGSRETTELKESILAASRAILITEGYEALSMRRLAREIGYSATAIYLYFENREAIVAELGRGGLEVLETYVSSAGKVSDPLAALEELGRQYLRFSVDHAESYRLIFMQDSALADAMFRSGPGKDAGGAGQRVFGLIVNGFERLQKKTPAWKKVNPLRAAEVFWTSLHGIVSLKLTCGKFLVTPAEDLAEVAVAALLAGLPKAFD